MTNTLPTQIRKYLIPLGLVLLTGVIAYSNSLNGPFQFDDAHISNRAHLFSKAYSSPTRQIADLTFLLNHYINGANVFGFHLLNLLIHLCTAVTLYFMVTAVITALIGDEPEDPDKSSYILQFVPFATAMLFVCHPIQTQAVTYIVQRYTSLATLFYLLSTLMFIKARIYYLNSTSHVQIWTVGMLAFISGLLAMRCKEIAFTLPVMLVIVELFIFQGRLLRNRFFLAGVALLLLIIPAQQIFKHGASGIDELIYSIDKGSKEEWTYSRMDYFQTQFRVVITYLRLLVFPINQNLDYDYPLQKIFFSAPVILSLMFHVLMLSSAAFMFYKSRLLLKGRSVIDGTCIRLCSLGIVWFYVALLVESSFIPILDVIFEHRVYLPSVGFFLTIVSLFALFLVHRESTRKSAWILLAIICLVLTAATINRNRVWNDEVRLWEDAASKSPHKIRTLNNLAAKYINRRMPEKAIVPILHVLDIEPGYPSGLYNLGILFDQIPQARGRYNNGLIFYTGVAKVNVNMLDPWYANTRNNLGLAYELLGERLKALAYYEQAATLSPKVAEPWLNLAYMSAQLGNKARAAEAFNKLKELDPQRAKSIEHYILMKQ